MDQPAATRYGVTNQTLMSWFKGYNTKVPEAEQVRPFNFLLTYQPKSRIEMVKVDSEALSSPLWRRRSPKPASRYSADLTVDRPAPFDRATGEPIAWEHLRSYRRTLVSHHLHSEIKFRDGEGDQKGALSRRHVEVWAVAAIGKEADNLDEREAFGEGDDAIVYGLHGEDRQRLIADLTAVQAEFGISDRTLTEQARVSHHTLAGLRKGGRVTKQSMFALVQAVQALRQEGDERSSEQRAWLDVAIALRDKLGSGNKLADLLGVSRPYLHRVLNGAKPFTDQMIVRIKCTSAVKDAKNIDSVR